ncbi:hypothetical protein [Chlorobium phaeobacteroides]|uniref:hypothetical protein n=1 Tax=Chlorobium phaeobacteroides TaxID=1096 RepID=UPI0002D85473|nr:hypothetical protein [Chlorobium phaeobacteroides]
MLNGIIAFSKNCGPPSVVYSVVGGHLNIEACGAASLAAAHLNVGTPSCSK